jgi:hypothetical protein
LAFILVPSIATWQDLVEQVGERLAVLGAELVE